MVQILANPTRSLYAALVPELCLAGFCADTGIEGRPLGARTERANLFAPESMRAGSFWLPLLAEEISSSTTFALLVGESIIGPWQVDHGIVGFLYPPVQRLVRLQNFSEFSLSVFLLMRFWDFSIFDFAEKCCLRVRSRRAACHTLPAHTDFRRRHFPVVDGLSSRSRRTAR